MSAALALSPVSVAADACRGELPLCLNLRHAGERDVLVRFEVRGDASLPAIVVLGGISAGRHVASSVAYPEAGWWERQRAVFDAHCVVSFDWIGADGTLDAPIDPLDQALAVAAVLDHLDIERVEAFVGCSYGAMVGLAFAARHGARLERLVAISGAHRAHPDASASRVIQRRIVALGGGSPAALALARALAMVGYRTAGELDTRFDAAPRIVRGRVRCESEDWLDACGARFASRFSPRAWSRLSESIDLHRVDPANIPVATTLLGIVEDRVVPIADLEALAARLPRPPRLVRLSSRYGHDAFLKEPAAVGAVLREALRGVA